MVAGIVGLELHRHWILQTVSAESEHTSDPD